MRKTIIFFFLILFFSNNVYSSSCESEFKKTEPAGEKTEVLVRAVKKMLEQDQLSPREQEAIVYSAGEFGKARAVLLKGLLKKNPTYRVQKIIVESAVEIGGGAKATKEEREAAASILKDLLELEPNPKPHIKEITEESAVKIGGEEGVGVLQDLLELELDLNSKPYTQKILANIFIRSSFKIGGELGTSVVIGIFAGVLTNIFARQRDMSPEVQEAFAEFASQPYKTEEKRIVNVFANLLNNTDSLSRHIQDFIAAESPRSLRKIDRELKVFILKKLLTKNPTSQVQKVIAHSAGNIGAEAGVEAKEAGVSILKDLLEQNPSLEVQVVILMSASQIGGKWETSIDRPPSLQEAFVKFAGENKTRAELIESVLKDFTNFEKDLSPQERNVILKSLRKIQTEFVENLEKDLSPQELEMDIPLELEVQEAIAYSAGKLGKQGAGVLKKLLKKNPKPHIKEIIVESAVKIGEEVRDVEARQAGAAERQEARQAAASVLKALLEMDIQLELGVQLAIAQSAGKLGKEGAGVLKYMLEKNPKPYVQEFIARSAGKLGAEAREVEARQAGAAERQEAEEAREVAASVLKDLLKRRDLSAFTERAIAESAGEIGGEEGAGMLKDLLERDPVFVVEKAIIRSAKRIEEETGIKIL